MIVNEFNSSPRLALLINSNSQFGKNLPTNEILVYVNLEVLLVEDSQPSLTEYQQLYSVLAVCVKLKEFKNVTAGLWSGSHHLCYCSVIQHRCIKSCS